MSMKKLATVLLSVAVTCSMFVGCGGSGDVAPTDASTEGSAQTEASADKETENGSYKVGITIQSLSNSYWAGVFGVVEEMMKEKGWESTIVDCQDNSAQQISQIENFTNSGCDLIMVHPSDPSAIEEVCKTARDAGIKVMCWDDQMTNTDVNWVWNNEEVGKAIGSAAAEFISGHYDENNKAQVAIMNYPQTPILLDRENGILKGLEEGAAGKYEVVAQQPALDAAAAQTAMETILQANPDCKVVCSIGAGGDIGSNEAFMAANGGKIPDDMGIFAADASEQQLEAIINGEATRISVGAEGSNLRTAQACVDMYEKLLTGEKLDEQNIYRPITVIDKSNAEEFLSEF